MADGGESIEELACGRTALLPRVNGALVTNGGGPLMRLRVPESPSAGQLVIGPSAKAAVKKLAEAIKIKYRPIIL
jgi:hypothetical protein